MSSDVLTLFDLDHTLVPHDSEASWAEFMVAQGLVDAREVTARSNDLTERYNRGEAAASEFSEFYLSLMAPHDPAVLDVLCERWIAERVQPRIVPAARRLVESRQAAGDRVVLSTGVFRFLAQPQARQFGIDQVIATEAERVDGRITGRVAGIANSREGKVERLHAWLAQSGERIAGFREVRVYADSINDVSLLSHATHPVAVNADALLAATARHAGWPILTVE